MKWMIPSALALGLLTAVPLSASASSVTCGTQFSGGVFISITTPSGFGAPSCFSSGNGTTLATASDPLLSSVLDTTQTGDNRTPALNVTFTSVPIFGNSQTDGTFSFDPTGYQDLKIGFQLFDGRHDIANPDWFVVSLADPAGQGSFDSDFFFGLSVSDPIEYAVLYGTQSPGAGPGQAPIPGALWLFGTVVAGAAGFKKLGKRRLSFVAA